MITVEEPIEFLHRHKRVAGDQREVGVDCTSFESALRAALREDPDVLLVGEMRDLETISIALTMAETGHLVFATMHTNDAAQSVDRIVDVFPAESQNQIRVQLAGSLAGGPLTAAPSPHRWGQGRGVRGAHGVFRRPQSGALREVGSVAQHDLDGRQRRHADARDLARRPGHSGQVELEDAMGATLYPKELEQRLGVQ